MVRFINADIASVVEHGWLTVVLAIKRTFDTRLRLARARTELGPRERRRPIERLPAVFADKSHASPSLPQIVAFLLAEASRRTAVPRIEVLAAPFADAVSLAARLRSDPLAAGIGAEEPPRLVLLNLLRVLRNVLPTARAL